MSWNVENLFDVGAEDGPETETELKAKLESRRSVIDEQRPHVLGSESPLGKLRAELKTPMQHKSVADATSAGSASRISAGGCCATRSRSGLSQAGCSESTPLELPSRSPRSPSAVRPALALTAAEGSRRSAASYLEAATSTSRETGRHAPVRNAERELSARDLSARPRRSDQGGRDAPARGPRPGRRGRARRAEGSAIGRGAEESQYGRARADRRAGVRDADPRGRR